jgi:enoyl-CoA hydratase
VPDLQIDRPEPEIALLTLDRPERKNALSIALRDEISGALEVLAGDEALKVVVITGAGDAFCAGFDLSEFDQAFADEAYADELWASSDRYHHLLLQFPLPTIAAVNGAALGGGFDLAVLCDLRIASTAARFAHPEYAFADVVYGPLCDLVGGAVARELCFTGRAVEADEALRIRLVNEVVADGEVPLRTSVRGPASARRGGRRRPSRRAHRPGSPSTKRRRPWSRRPPPRHLGSRAAVRRARGAQRRSRGSRCRLRCAAR